MDPTFPDVVGEWAADAIDDRARVWTITRSTEGRIEERLDDSFLATLGRAESIEELVDAVARAAGALEIAETRIW